MLLHLENEEGGSSSTTGLTKFYFQDSTRRGHSTSSTSTTGLKLNFVKIPPEKFESVDICILFLLYIVVVEV